MTAVLGCDDGADQGATNESTATSCAIESFDSSWWNQSFPEQTGIFHVEFAAAVTAANMDVVIGLSNGAASRWASLAAIVRFNPQGFIDARDAGVYRADASVPYEANTRYWFRFDIDVRAHTYSVWFKHYEWAEYSPLARNYRFRTEQASVTRLNNVAAFVNPETSAHGSAEICGFAAVKDNTTGDGCVASNAGGGFANAIVTPSSTVSFVRFTAKAGQAGMDGVVGVASGDVDAYDDFAASIRFFTNGYIEARDGGAYRADRQIAYTAGAVYDFRLIADLASDTYSVYVSGPGIDDAEFARLASGYRFRPAQAGVTSLDRIATVVASAGGRVDACKLGAGPREKVVAMRDGSYDVAPVANGSAWIASETRTTLLDGNNAPLGSVEEGGQVAADATGNVYLARYVGGQLWASSFTASFAHRWSALLSDADGRLHDLIVNDAGEATLAVGGVDTPPLQVITTLGSPGTSHGIGLPLGTEAIGLAGSQYIVARRVDGGYLFETYTYTNNSVPIRSRRIDGNYWVEKIALAPDGSFVIAGALGGPMNFGDGEIAPYAPSPDSGVYWDAFIASFAPDFTLRFSRRMTNTVTGLVTNGREMAVSYQTWTQLYYTSYVVLDPYGNALRGIGEDAIVGSFGFTGDIALAESGRVYWNLRASFSGPGWIEHWFLVTIDP